jgi:hypothetical protein
MRRAPADGERINVWPEGTRLTLLSEERRVDSRTWRLIRGPDGSKGWMASEYLIAPAGAAPSGQGGTSESIPGLTAARVIQAMEGRGLRCADPGAHRTMLSWECRGREGSGSADYVVQVRAEGADRARLIGALVLQSGPTAIGDLATRFLAPVATIPSEGGQQQRARQWVLSNMTTGGETIIGRAKLRLSAEGTGRSLEISALDVP